MPYKSKEKKAAHNAARYVANKEKIVAYQRFRTTGVTQEQYEEAYLKQKGVCAICSCDCSSGKKLSADHCHATKLFRGLLCSSCNLGLGCFKDNIKLMENAMSYLKEKK